MKKNRVAPTAPNRYSRKKSYSPARKRDDAIKPRVQEHDGAIQHSGNPDVLGVVPYANRLKRYGQTAYSNRLKRYGQTANGQTDSEEDGGWNSAVTITPQPVWSLNDLAKMYAALGLDGRDDDDGDLDKLWDMTAVDFDTDRYARHGVHETEIRDYVRTITFKNCIEQCVKRRIKNKVVLVVRCGIGLLPMLCVRIGLAKKVIALEQSSCIEYARRIIKDNFFSQEITLIQSSVHDLKKLPDGFTEVDIIMSDFMGECVLGQGDQMEQVIEARDRFLKPDGLMIPMCVTLYGQLLEQKSLYENRRVYKNKNKKKNSNNHELNQNVNGKNVDKTMPLEDYNSDSSTDEAWCSWWQDVYGFDMRSKREFIVLHNSEGRDYSASSKEKWCICPEPLFAYFDPLKVVSDACLIKEFNMHECTINDVRHVHCKDLKLVCITPNTSANGGDYAHMLELFMVVDFPDGQKVQKKINEDVNIGFSTSSFSPFTRFKQTGLFLSDQLLIDSGDKFTINEFVIWRGPQQNDKNKMFDTIMSKNISGKSMYEENLKIRLRYTFVNKHMNATNRRCVYTLIKYIF